jgi:tRNA dimethylallyltransferase
VIYGPTGVGKTEFALALARKLRGHMINADVGQFYLPLTIGTAKPDLATIGVSASLFNYIDQPVDFSVVAFRSAVSGLLDQIIQKNELPIIVGGSGFYISSLFYSLPVSGTQAYEFGQKTAQELWQELERIDPERAAEIKPTDSYRIKRALSIWYETGQRPSAFKPTFRPVVEQFLFINLIRDTTDLYQRINERVLTMLEGGWIAEVKQLQNTAWQDFLENKKLLGYPEILQYLKAGSTDHKAYTRLIEIIQQRTRNYAKRQLTFGRMLVHKLHINIGFGQQLMTINLTRTTIKSAVAAAAGMIDEIIK